MTVNGYQKDEENLSFSFQTLKKLVHYAVPHKKSLGFALFINLFSIIGSLIGIQILQYALDYTLPNKNEKQLFILALLFIGVIIGSILCNRIKDHILNKTNQNMIATIKQDLFTHLQYLSNDFFDNHSHGKILIRLTDYAENISSFITYQLVSNILQIFNLLLTFLFMWFTNMNLSLLIVFGVFLLVLIYLFSLKDRRRKVLLLNHKNANLNAFSLESLRGVKTIQIFEHQKKTEESYQNLTRDVCQKNRDMLPYWNFSWFSIQNLSQYVSVSIYLVGFLFLYPRISLGTIVAMGNYSFRFWSPIEILFNNFNEFLNSLNYLERIMEFLEEPILIKDSDGVIETVIEGKIEFQNVDFSYRTGNPILKNISFQINPKEKVAFVGESGSGKSTIVNLMTRFYEIQKGQIQIDNTPIEKLSIHSIRTGIVTMTQDNFLFSDTIMNNLKYGNRSVSDERVKEVCQKLEIDDWIMTFPEGYHTVITHNGEILSDGERQLISYARVIIADPSVVILDEATSKIDIKTEDLIANSLKNVLSEKTVVTIAHRLSSIIDYDKIFFLEDHKIKEWGTHRELMNLNGGYAKLFEKQNEWFE